MNRIEYVVISELGMDWAGQADLARSRFSTVATLVQWHGESPLQFARRVKHKLRLLRGVRGAALLLADDGGRVAVGARQQIVGDVLERLDGVPGRELTVRCCGSAGGQLPRWLATLADGIEERDPALELYVERHDLESAA